MTHEHKHKFVNILLAAGAGTRMRSSMPKVMHKLAGMPMVTHVVRSVAPLQPEKTIVVVAPHMDEVKQAVLGCDIAIQHEQKGTGHAVKCAVEMLESYQGTVLVLYGDTPMITTQTISELLVIHTEKKATISMLGMQPDSPMGYGRLAMKTPPFVERIIECKDATDEEKKISWVWAGVMAFDATFLRESLHKLAPSAATGEYYLTSLIEMATAQKDLCVMVPISVNEAMGINDRMQLAQAEQVIQQRLRTQAMQNGVTLIDPKTVYLSMDTKLGRDIIIYPHVVCAEGVEIADNVELRSFSHLEGVTIHARATVGPFARLRPDSVIGEGAHVGNFVELKKTTLGKGAKVNHLSYVGDTTVGQGANIGAGTITCNYDGVHKHNTVIGDNAFIGSNSSLVAPVTIGAGALIAAGSVITQDVADEELAIARSHQTNKTRKS
jgi:bifunctional UDP-N-acetylglucosamine pyrophosphorylase / glucosamine-1-phosphate N-acetyltransferase